MKAVNGKTGNVVLNASDVGAAEAVHNHDGTYASASVFNNLVGDTKVSDQIANAIKNKSDTSHNHNGVYSLASHTHTAAQVTSTIHSANGNGDSAQYLRIARFTISTQYQNQSFSLQITQRRLPYVGTVHIQFDGGTDPSVSAFAVDEVGLKCYLNRASQGVFDFYVAKKENWDSMQVVGLDKGSYMDSTTIEWVSENVATLPSGYIEATLVQNQHNYVPDVNDGRSTTFAYSKSDFTSPSYFAVWNSSELRTLPTGSVRSVIGAAAASHSHNYLPTSGGTLTTTGDTALILKSGHTKESWQGFMAGDTKLGYFGFQDVNVPSVYINNQNTKLWHASNLKFSLSGSTLSITTT